MTIFAAFIAYFAVPLGVGQVFARVIGSRSPFEGTRFLLGSALTLLIFSFLHILLPLSLAQAGWCVAALGVAGWAYAFAGARLRVEAEDLIQPAVVIPLVAFGVVLWQGQLDYLPYTVDEFTNWIGIAKLAFLQEDFAGIRNDIHLPGYLPGWRLWLLLPWVLFDEFLPGSSALAPLALHVGLLGLIYAFARQHLGTVSDMPRGIAILAAWALLLVLVAAEVTGRIWAFNLLIEPPQIYFGTAAVLAVLAAYRAQAEARTPWIVAAVIFVTACYFVKSAGMIWFGALVLTLLAHAVFKDRRITAQTLWQLGWAFGVFGLVHMAWSSGVVTDSCLSKPFDMVFRPEIPAHAQGNISDFTRRFGGELGGYFGGYKTPVSLIAFAGLVWLIKDRAWQPLLAIGAFGVVYFGSLYWFHIVCFSEYYFNNPNSIPRFARVFIQTCHALGMFYLGLKLAGLLIPRISALLPGHLVTAGLAAVIAAGGLWQIDRLAWTARDVTTRVHQDVDFRVAEMKRLAEIALGGFPDAKPYVITINQGTDKDHLGYLGYFALRKDADGAAPGLRFNKGASWAPDPVNHFQATADQAKLRDEFAGADIIWPLKTDAWIDEILANLPSDIVCPLNAGTHYLIRPIRNAGDGGLAPFSCREKGLP